MLVNHVSYIFCLISGVHLVTRVTPSCLMGNVFLTVSLTFLKSSFQGMKSAEAAPGLFYLLYSSVFQRYEHEEVLTLCNDYHRFFFFSRGTVVDCSMWSWFRYAERLEHSQVHFPLTFPRKSSSFHCSLPDRKLQV